MLQWTPALSPNGEHLPHGMIFSCFMASSMVGSALAGRVLGNSRHARRRPWCFLLLLPACPALG
jgi:Sugar-tranasporters, 12 TM